MLREGTPCISSDVNVLNRLKVIEPLLARSPAVANCLDAGCGFGAYLNALARHCPSVVGVDINPDYLLQARANCPTALIGLASLTRLAFPAECFEFITCIETLEHVDQEELVIQEFHRILKPGGRLVISVPYKGFPFETHGIHCGGKVISSPFGLGFPLLTYLPDGLRRHFATARVYPRAKLVKLLTGCGFTVEQVTFLMPGLDIFERKSGARLLAGILRRTLDWLQERLRSHWGSTIVVVARR